MSALTRGLLAAALIAAPFAIADRANATQWGTNYPTTAHPNENLWAGQATVARVFEPARLRTWDDYPAAVRAYEHGVRRFWFSWKGTLGSDVRAFGATIPDDVQVWGTWLHEPENDVEAGRLTIAEWKSTTKRLGKVQRSVGMKPASVLMFWTLLPESGRDIEDWRLPKGAVDVWAFDAHMKATPRTPKQVATKLLAEKKRSGLPMGLAETSAPERPQRLYWLHQRLKGNVWWACFFARRNDEVTKQEVDAWMR